jgi:hypothetical protein
VFRCSWLFRMKGFSKRALCSLAAYGHRRKESISRRSFGWILSILPKTICMSSWSHGGAAQQALQRGCASIVRHNTHTQDPYIQSRLHFLQNTQIHSNFESPCFPAKTSRSAHSSLLLLSISPSKQWQPQTKTTSKKKRSTYSVETTTYGPGAAPTPVATLPSTETVQEQ